MHSFLIVNCPFSIVNYMIQFVELRCDDNLRPTVLTASLLGIIVGDRQELATS